MVYAFVSAMPGAERRASLYSLLNLFTNAELEEVEGVLEQVRAGRVPFPPLKVELKATAERLT